MTGGRVEGGMVPEQGPPEGAWLEDAAEVRGLIEEARARIGQVVSGQQEAITLLLIALGARGHILLEGIPGLGKTTLANTFADVTGLSFSRVQLTPDLMPTDLTGHTFFDQQDQSFKLRQGPVFTNVLLADEINRTPPRTQAALLEVMQEGQVTIEDETHKVPDPFLVVATKNPIEVEGVYPLPEAELDRFMLHTRLGYPDRDTEAHMLDGKLGTVQPPDPLPDLARTLQRATKSVRVHPDVRDYLLDIVEATREHELIELGASPRASEHLLQASRAYAALQARAFALPDDVQAMARPVIRHRILLTADAEVQDVDPDDVLSEVLDRIEVPVEPDEADRDPGETRGG